MRARQWARDLAMGARFALAGGREGWVRLLLTAVGVGLGVALLLLTTAVPNIASERSARQWARSDFGYEKGMPRADNTLLVGDANTTYHNRDIRGRELEPEGARAPLPPGVGKFPHPGEMVVSPGLGRLLKSDDGKLLRERLPQHIVGTIGDSGLVGPAELAFYRGGDGLAHKLDSDHVARFDRFGYAEPSGLLTPILMLVMLVMLVVLLMPVVIFIATAVRFGGDRRDRRLAALRLVGSDSRMTRRIAAGEALTGVLLGLVFGVGFFLIGRQIAGSIELFGVSVFPSFLNPSPTLALLVAVAVPVAAVLVTLFALRGVVIEPLGVVRATRPPRRWLWWRLLLPLGGLGLLYPMVGQGGTTGNFNQYMVVGGVFLLLVGVTVLLPWIVEAVVARLNSGGVAWQLAVRRLQLSSGSAARMVNGIAVAVAGAIALQMLFSGIQNDYTTESKRDVRRVQMQMTVPSGMPLVSALHKFAETKGVSRVYAYSEGYLRDTRKEPSNLHTEVTVGDCASLRAVAMLPSCRDGDTFAVRSAPADDIDTPEMAQPGRTLYFDTSYKGSPQGEGAPWMVPQGIRQVQSRTDPTGTKRIGFLVTPGALPDAPAVSGQIYLRLDESVPDVRDLVRNTAVTIDPYNKPIMWASEVQSSQYTSIRTGLFVGAACVLALIGASLLVSQLEQLREHKKLLSSLVAFGARRRTLSLSVLWQAVIPIALGLLLASAIGLTLGAILLKMTDKSVRVDWASVLTMTGIGAGVALLVTLLSLLPLLRMMRPDGLRTE
ncbi:ABC transporter permease [Streptomyces sp.]|uniref:ABC transporter permease n=1 Tax=Streptomyces sp. TaxID=1931 RepID=UPI002D772172|nr:FtsX-like permease family protein [Streptomyces sp.]HET6355920.1 FtsX-like permease family protein [Streptomyces sp.]